LHSVTQSLKIADTEGKKIIIITVNNTKLYTVAYNVSKLLQIIGQIFAFDTE